VPLLVLTVLSIFTVLRIPSSPRRCHTSHRCCMPPLSTSSRRSDSASACHA
jgi:hypothetical protein